MPESTLTVCRILSVDHYILVRDQMVELGIFLKVLSQLYFGAFGVWHFCVSGAGCPMKIRLFVLYFQLNRNITKIMPKTVSKLHLNEVTAMKCCSAGE